MLYDDDDDDDDVFKMYYVCERCNTDVFSYQAADVRDVTVKLSNKTCDVRLRMRLDLVKKTDRGQQFDDTQPDKSDKKQPDKEQPSRVDGVLFACPHCEHNLLLQFIVRIDRRHDIKVSAC